MVIIDGDELVVRNFLRDHRIRRSEVRGLGAGTLSTRGSGVETIVVETTSGSIPLDVLATYSEGLKWLPLSSGALRRNERAMRLLSAWVDQTSAHDIGLPR